MLDPHGFDQIVRGLVRRLARLERAEPTRMVNLLFAALPTPDSTHKGRMRFVTNGRKNGEGAGVGTGVVAYDDGAAWRRMSDDSVVAA